jgi:hypothetical protein
MAFRFADDSSQCYKQWTDIDADKVRKAPDVLYSTPPYLFKFTERCGHTIIIAAPPGTPQTYCIDNPQDGSSVCPSCFPGKFQLRMLDGDWQALPKSWWKIEF